MKKIILPVLIMMIQARMIFAQLSGIEPAEVCSQCHAQIYEEWQKSGHAHSSAARNPLYAAMLDWAVRDSDGALENTCRSCHEPVRLHPLPSSHSRSRYAEGVTCDICHAAYPQKNGSLTLLQPTPEGIKLGKHPDAISSYHKSQVSENLQRSSQCLQCHAGLISRNNNLEICSTGPEWEASPFRKLKIECQDCHMVSRAGKSADLGKLREEIRNHSFSGNSEEFIRVAVTFNMDVAETADSLIIKVKVLNRGAGHSIPSGSPLRSMVVTVNAIDQDDVNIWRNWSYDPVAEDRSAVLMRYLVNKQGAGPVPPWQAHKVLFDHRIPSKKEIILTYRIPRQNIKAVEATLDYLVAPINLLRKFGITDETITTPRRVGALTRWIKQEDQQ